MKVASVVAATILAGGATALPSASPHLSLHTRDEFAAAAANISELVEAQKAQILASLEADNEKLRKRGLKPKCTPQTVSFRREYGSLSRQEKLDYINAVKCLQSLPARTPASVSAGAVSRFDDFTVVHIQQTLSIHYSGIFMPWHRWFTYQFETALREECGYTGYQTYWDWPKYASSPETSPLFDGSDTSIGGNGEYIPHDGPIITPPEGIGGGDIQLPAGTGSGNVTTGAFANMTVTLGPVGGLKDTPAGPDGGLGSNPRTLKRDLGGAMNTRYANYTTVWNLLNTKDIYDYRHLSEGIPYTPEIGPHGGIHYTIGGDPGGDLFTSPGDPAFWQHHGMMDRMWTIWQTLDPSTRYTDLDAGDYGHQTWQNSPESNKTTLCDTIDMGYAGESTTIGMVMNTLSNGLCYYYL
ncbi:Di-copper centre-containing protein [Thozetella sp. PMI_491]|nr:Di-copper centre-containing protein [Thozetella sp. PMI_491]